MVSANAYADMRAELETDPLHVLQTIAEMLRATAVELRSGRMSQHHAANRLGKIADIIAEQDGDA